jgi:uncharacterized membrane protein YfbV (UPF0208 family)
MSPAVSYRPVVLTQLVVADRVGPGIAATLHAVLLAQHQLQVLTKHLHSPPQNVKLHVKLQLCIDMVHSTKNIHMVDWSRCAY